MKVEINKLKRSINIWFWVIIVYATFINIFVIKATPELIALQFALFTLLFRKKHFSNFLKDWFPFIGLFLLFELLRGFADNLSPFFNTTLFWIYRAELSLFPTLPTIYLQHRFLENSWVLIVALLFYTSFFYYSFLVAYILWLKNRLLFLEYIRLFLILSFIGLVFFFLIPTAPPWYTAIELEIEIKRPVYQNVLKLHESTLLYYFLYANPVAALPSMHVAWPMFTSLFIIKKGQHKSRYLLLVIPLMIGFSVILTGEHFLLDVIAGCLLACLVNRLK